VGDEFYASFGPRDPEDPIPGELVEIGEGELGEVLARLDEIEGEWFRRRVIDVRRQDDRWESALVYEWWQSASTGQLLAAARRKIEIAAFHHESLERLECLTEPAAEWPRATVPAQATFEGILIAFDAAVDQVTAALRYWPRVSWADGQPPGTLDEALDLHETRRSNAPGIGGLRVWSDDPIVDDVRRVRNLVVHSAYSKSGRFSGGAIGLIVQPVAGSRLEGDAADRRVEVYARRAVDHLRRLRSVIDDLGSAMPRPRDGTAR
jgi:hypothetical protein